MTEDIYTVAILLLLPLTAGMLVSQVNPYHALILRGILGAVAALVYALFGAADVALTEALVGTMLSITLYAVAVRSSMSMRLGIVETVGHDMPSYEAFLASLREHLQTKQLRLEVVSFSQTSALQSAFLNKEIHAALMGPDASTLPDLPLSDSTLPDSTLPDSTLLNDSHVSPCCLQIRVRRLYEILHSKLSYDWVNLQLAELDTPNVSGKVSGKK